MKIVKSFKGITQTIESKPKEKSSGFLVILLGTLGTSLLELKLAG